MPTLRAQVTFRVKEPGAEPAISVKQSSKGVEIFPENLVFDLKPGPSMKDAERIANYLNENEAATNLRKLLLSEGHLPAPTLARDLNEARFGAGSYGAGKTNSVTHRTALYLKQIRFAQREAPTGV